MSETRSLQQRENVYTLPHASSIDEEQQERLNVAEEQEKAIPPQRMTQRKARVRGWLTRKPELGRYDNLLTELHKEGQKSYKNYLRIKHDPLQEMS